MNKSLTQASQQKAMETERKAAASVFECQQEEALKSPKCSGFGFPTEPGQTFCIYCLTLHKKSLQSLTG